MYGFEVRKSEHKDFEAIRSLLIICFGGRTETDTALEKDVADGHMMVMTHNTKIIATVGIVYDNHLKGQKVTCACTHPSYRRAGVMQELLMRAIKELKTENKLYCEALRLRGKENANLHTILLSLGFREIKHNYLVWTTHNCRVAAGFSCVNQCDNSRYCECYEDLWVYD